MMKFDVIVSGAGPGGSKAAELLARGGLRTALVERNANWRKPCGGGLPRHVDDDFGVPEKVRENTYYARAFISADGTKLVLETEKEPGGCVVDRLVYDAYLRDTAVDCGATLFDKSTVKDVILKNGRVVGVKVRTPEGLKEMMADVVIAADGVASRIAVRSGLRAKWKPDELAKCVVAFIDGYEGPKYNHFYFFDFMGYAWIFPMSGKRANVGVGLLSSGKRSVLELFDWFLRSKYFKEMFRREKIVVKQGYPVPFSSVSGQHYGDGIMLVGDAGGFVSPVTGEGVYYALWTGKLAAETTILAYEREDFSGNTLKEYKRKLDERGIVEFLSGQLRLRDLIYSNQGRTLNLILKAANEDERFKDELRRVLFEGAKPSAEFAQKLMSFM